MINYRTDRSVRLPLDFPLSDMPSQGPAAMSPWYNFRLDVIMPRPRKPDQILVEEVIFVGSDRTEHRYGQRDLVRDLGKPMVGNPMSWL
jgi:hypothetical protein